jgi:hypothetical protein
MSKSIYIFLAFFLCFSLSAAAAGKRPPDAWSFYYFDGTAFSSGQNRDGSAFIAVKENVQPVVLASNTSHITLSTLPEGTGVIAGICYVQNSGGKLGNNSVFTPYPRVPIHISAGGKPFVTVRTDDYGYFVAVLPSGIYSVGSGPSNAEIAVERGITTLVPLRVGKRMVD